ncbi:unnamed protein product [Didymodactylos carnosus]|uniref:LIM zinc-binding domain-containing protein n=1 Tax=Didymodactylos carnosus TaxID=1234261 RepID=A0A814JQG6_9BILA|nr:unnamed protein product [Didymodactylos carnosus]CAF1042357.1 unnamed protein product [Didymodactylos carnosus]CAF3601928.1 unnamed protein product [Didymodactylos carnosus]CAF3812503.1 unnamed protein product [Didymodactylos carnosus]
MAYTNSSHRASYSSQHNTPTTNYEYGQRDLSRQSGKREGVYNGEYNRSLNNSTTNQYAQDNFSCWHCDKNLSGSRYILKDEHPFCIKCYEDRFANACEECKRKIGTDSKDLSYKDRHWHEKCFFCSMCKTPLVDKPFGCKNDLLYCGECYNQQFASRCDKCHQIFKPGTKKLEYKGQQFHEHCFTCFSCSQPIGTKSFIPKDQRSYCVPCYEEHFATKCTRCQKVIAQGGVTYKNQPWHRDCFMCTNCKQSLAGQRFTSRDDHPYCADCFARLFAKKCYACSKPITGVGGTRYISFEDRHWHNDCFVCQRCHSSLVGRGFLTEGSDILCPECGKQTTTYDQRGGSVDLSYKN